MCELYKQAGLDPKKICGVTSLDIVRANKFVHEATGQDLESIDVPVVGGHAGVTILPLFSQVPAMNGMPAEKVIAMDKHLQDAGTDVVNAKGGKGSATLSMAYAGAKFGNAVLCGLAGVETTECAYVARDAGDELPYLASKVTFGKGGVQKVHAIGNLNAHEQTRWKECVGALKDAILGLIVNPVNSVVPAMCELYKQAGLDPKKICGVTSLDIVRANKFVHEATGQGLESIDVPVVGGHAGVTILPLFSQVSAMNG